MRIRFIKDTPHYRGKGKHRAGDIVIVKDDYAKECIEKGNAQKTGSIKSNTGIPKHILELQKAEKKVKSKSKK